MTIGFSPRSVGAARVKARMLAVLAALAVVQPNTTSAPDGLRQTIRASASRALSSPAGCTDSPQAFASVADCLYGDSECSGAIGVAATVFGSEADACRATIQDWSAQLANIACHLTLSTPAGIAQDAQVSRLCPATCSAAGVAVPACSGGGAIMAPAPPTSSDSGGCSDVAGAFATVSSCLSGAADCAGALDPGQLLVQFGLGGSPLAACQRVVADVTNALQPVGCPHALTPPGSATSTTPLSELCPATCSGAGVQIAACAPPLPSPSAPAPQPGAPPTVTACPDATGAFASLVSCLNLAQHECADVLSANSWVVADLFGGSVALACQETVETWRADLAAERGCSFVAAAADTAPISQLCPTTCADAGVQVAQCSSLPSPTAAAVSPPPAATHAGPPSPPPYAVPAHALPSVVPPTATGCDDVAGAFASLVSCLGYPTLQECSAMLQIDSVVVQNTFGNSVVEACQQTVARWQAHAAGFGCSFAPLAANDAPISQLCPVTCANAGVQVAHCAPSPPPALPPSSPPLPLPPWSAPTPPADPPPPSPLMPPLSPAIVVTTTSELRAAVAAVPRGENATLSLPQGGTFPLGGAPIRVISIRLQLTSRGAGATIDAETRSRLFKVSGGAHLRLNSLTLANGKVNALTARGGALHISQNSYVLLCGGSVIRKSRVVGRGYAEGGAVWLDEGSLTLASGSAIVDSTVSVPRDVAVAIPDPRAGGGAIFVNRHGSVLLTGESAILNSRLIIVGAAATTNKGGGAVCLNSGPGSSLVLRSSSAIIDSSVDAQVPEACCPHGGGAIAIATPEDESLLFFGSGRTTHVLVTGNSSIADSKTPG